MGARVSPLAAAQEDALLSLEGRLGTGDIVLLGERVYQSCFRAPVGCSNSAPRAPTERLQPLVTP
jgi:hypothetical protein